MEGKTLILLATVAVVFGSPVSQPTPITELLPALKAYVDWSAQVSAQFLNDITSLQVRQLEETGEIVYDRFIAAIQQKESELGVDIDTDKTNKDLLTILEAGLVDSVGADKLVGLLLGTSSLENHGSRLAVATQVFSRLTGVKLTEVLNQLKGGTEIDSDKLNEIVDLVLASEIAFDAMTSNFEIVEDTILGDEDDVSDGGSSDDATMETTTADGIVTRRKRQISPIRLGGGFSTNGRSLIWNRGRTTVRATPRFTFNRRPRFNGGSAGFEHRFRNNRGSIFGSASMNGRGRFTGAHVGLRIRF